MIFLGKVITITELIGNLTGIVDNVFSIMSSYGEKADHRLEDTQYIRVDGKTYYISSSYNSFFNFRQFGHLPNFDGRCPALFVPKELYYDSSYSSLLHNYHCKIITYGQAQEIKTILSNYAADSIMIISFEKRRKKTRLIWYLLNIVPSHDGICHQIVFNYYGKSGTNFIKDQIMFLTQKIMDLVSETFTKYRIQISKSQDRLILELQILYNMGYDVELKETRNGYGFEIPLPVASNSVIKYMGGVPDSVTIGITMKYPLEEPLIVLKRNTIFKKVDLDWNENFTIGHVIRALKEGE